MVEPQSGSNDDSPDSTSVESSSSGNEPIKMGVAFASLTGSIFHASPDFCELVGLSMLELLDQPVTALFYPDQPARSLALLDDFLEDPGWEDFEYEHLAKDGRRARLRLTIVLGTFGHPQALLVYAWDGLASLGRGLRVGVLQLDLQHRLTHLDKCLLGLWGFSSPHTALGTSIGSLFVDSEEIDRAISKAGPKNWGGRLIARLGDGSTTPLDVLVEVLFSRKRRLLGSVVLCCLRRQPGNSSFPVRSDVATVTAIRTLSHLAILTTDTGGRILQANHASQVMFGREESLVDQPIETLFAESSQAALSQQLALGSGRMEFHQKLDHQELVGLHRDGTSFPIEVSILTLDHHEGSTLLWTIKDLSEAKRLEVQLSWHVTHDALTRLPNRTLLKDRLNVALNRSERERRSLALFFIDLDGFKIINEGFGHDVGDRVLVIIAERLVATVRPGDTVSRFGGDEFVVLCEQMEEPEAISSLVDRMVTAIRKPIPIANHSVSLTASIGVAIGEMGQVTSEDLLRNADSTMYLAKEGGRDNWRIFNDSIHERAQQELELASGLRVAIEQGEMRAFYQPIINTQTGQIKGAELLLRWFRPNGMVPPDRFIPIAERTGSILEIGVWVFEQACLAQVRFAKRFPNHPLYLSVNLSVRQVYDPGLLGKFETILQRTGADPRAIILELTESTLMHDLANTILLLGRLEAMGFQLAVDDFGTGYSSLSQLMRLPVSCLKIDKAFVQGLDVKSVGKTIVSAITKMGSALKMRVIAEGVETAEQFEYLRDLGCNGIQGYFFFRPMPLEEFSGLLERESLSGAPAEPELNSGA